MENILGIRKILASAKLKKKICWHRKTRNFLKKKMLAPEKKSRKFRLSVSYLNENFFGIEQAVNCRFDKLVINDVEYCGSKQPGPIIIESNLVDVEFITDGSVVNSGFEITWSVLLPIGGNHSVLR